jgi:prevent-host-death family protein
MKTVGSYEAKTHLASLLADVENGEYVTITKHGRPIAVLRPYIEDGKSMTVREATAALRDFPYKIELDTADAIALVAKDRRY